MTLLYGILSNQFQSLSVLNMSHNLSMHHVVFSMAYVSVHGQEQEALES